MAISFVNVGTIASGTSGNITPALPAAIAAGDILVLVVGSADNVVVSLPAGYTKKIELNSSTNCRLTVAWARATGSDSAPLVTHAAGSSIFGVIGAYRGCKSTGDPFTDAQSQANAGTTTTITAPTITPLNGDFVIFAAACGEGGTNNGGVQSLSGWSGTNPTLTERADYPDQGLGTLLCDGGFADGASTGGATGSRTVTLAATAQATANSVGALLALTQDAGGASFPQSAMLPLSGLQLPHYPSVAQAPPTSPEVVVDWSGLPASRFLNPLSFVLGPKLFPFPQPIVTPASVTSVTPAGLDHGRALGTGPQVNPSLGPAGLVHSRSIGTGPQVNPSLGPASLVHTRALGTITVNIVTTLSPASLTRTRALGAPQVNVSLAPAALTRTRVLGAPTVSPQVVLGALVHTRTLGGPVAVTAQSITVASLVHDRALGALGKTGLGFPGPRRKRRIGALRFPFSQPPLQEWPEGDPSEAKPIFRRTRRGGQGDA